MTLKHNDSVTFDAITHSYFIGDKEIIGVTSLMKGMGLSPDYSGIDPHVLNHAAARGTAIHKTLESYDNGENVLIPITVSDNEGGTATFDTSEELKAYKGLYLNVLASEYLVSDNETCASMIDKVIAVSEDEVALGDIKTTSTLHTEALEWQLSIYAYLFELQNQGVKVRDLYGIHVRDGRAKAVQVRRIPSEEVERLLTAYRNGEDYDGRRKEDALSLVLKDEEIADLINGERQIADIEISLKHAQEQVKESKERIYAYMLANGIKELHCKSGKYTLRTPTVRKGFDSKRFKKDNPELYGKYATTSEVKGSITFKFNES